jgi:hypothetical protein
MAQKNNNTPWVLGFIAFTMIFNKAFGDSKDDQAGAAELEKLEKLPPAENPFNVNGFKCPLKKGVFRYTLSTAAATKAASTINAGIGYVSDDEAQILGGIKAAGTKADLHFIASMYSRVYKRDLYTDLKKNLAKKAELGAMIAAYVNKLPLYVKKGVKA